MQNRDSSFCTRDVEAGSTVVRRRGIDARCGREKEVPEQLQGDRSAGLDGQRGSCMRSGRGKGVIPKALGHGLSGGGLGIRDVDAILEVR